MLLKMYNLCNSTVSGVHDDPSDTYDSESDVRVQSAGRDQLPAEYTPRALAAHSQWYRPAAETRWNA